VVRFVVRHNDDRTIGIVARIRAVRRADGCEEGREQRSNERAPLAESAQHQGTTVAAAPDHVK
jgi:hypothetical protein